MNADELPPEPRGLPTRVLVLQLGTVVLPTDLVVRYRAVNREKIGGQAMDTPGHLDALEVAVRTHGIQVPLVLAINHHYGFLDGNHRLAVARRLRLPEVPVEVWTAPADLYAEYGRELLETDLRLIIDRLALDYLPVDVP